ncbi:MAG TPA: T9SS type A sorting domain-containing protein [Chitinophagaceae bacterium]|nr:T9SS type A sorting domain-containing protein [Chitinophagaceae bacterium]
MRSNLLLILFLLPVCNLSAQLTITPGAQFSIVGNTKLCLNNTDLVNDGSFTSANSMVAFSGDNISFIRGNQPIQFFEFELNKENFANVVLEREVGITERLLFSSGFLLLNGFNVNLGTTGHLDGEKESSRIYGPTGGEVLFNVNLNSPANSNPANLGVFITANQDLGNVTIRRGHQSQVISSGIRSSVLRYYTILAANNSNLDASLRFRYFDEELNGHAENVIEFFQNPDNSNWTSLGATSRDVVGNIVEKTGLSTLGKFTLSSPGSVLPVSFTLFNATCENSKLLLTWKTAQEQNSSHFSIERSMDGSNWTVVGSLPAAGTSSTERTYFFTDHTARPNSFYRIAQTDQDGRVQHSGTIRSTCSFSDIINLWPNPVHEDLFINLVTPGESQAIVRVFDSKASLIRLRKAALLPGSNRFSVDMRALANGVYTIVVEWNRGQMKKSQQVLKQ